MENFCGGADKQQAKLTLRRALLRAAWDSCDDAKSGVESLSWPGSCRVEEKRHRDGGYQAIDPE